MSFVTFIAGAFNYHGGSAARPACGISGSSLTVPDSRNTINRQGNGFFGEKLN
jgi:hypothetical protein